MMDFYLSNRDIVINQGDIALCPNDTACISQTIITRLKIIAGEWFLDSSLGVPYFTHIFGQDRSFSASYIKELIVTEILAIAGVKEINNFSATKEPHRKLLLTFEVVLQNGEQKSFKEVLGV